MIIFNKHRFRHVRPEQKVKVIITFDPNGEREGYSVEGIVTPKRKIVCVASFDLPDALAVAATIFADAAGENLKDAGERERVDVTV